MPKQAELAEIVVGGQRYANWDSVSVTRSGMSVVPTFTFTAASPIESATNFAGLKLKIGDPCEVLLAGRRVIRGQIRHRQPAFDANQHGLQIGGTSLTGEIVKATVDHNQGEFKNYTLSQILNSVFKPYGIKFNLKGSTDGADKVFEKVNVQTGELLFNFAERLCRMRNVFMFSDMDENIVGYRMGSAADGIADLQEGRNILSASAVFDYNGAYAEHQAIGQNTGNDQRFGDAARDVTGSAKNPAVPNKTVNRFMMEQPGDKADALMRAQHENAHDVGSQVQVTIVVQGWFANQDTLWLEHIGEPVSVYSPMLFTDDRLNLAIQEVTSTQNAGGTMTTLTLVLPEAYNGIGTIQGGSVPPQVYGA
ncbi:phage baseplate assembly protein [Methylobacterium sp. SI9]|uniref:phage baseplate assembly protein n=1 Tax=Methylobacterium guangdongense TaxID=3138811 RepID=UPI00313B73A6